MRVILSKLEEMISSYYKSKNASLVSKVVALQKQLRVQFVFLPISSLPCQQSTIPNFNSE